MILNDFSFAKVLSAKRCTSKLCAGAANGEEGFFPVSVVTQGSLLAFGRAYGPRGSGGGSEMERRVSGLFVVFYEVFCMVPSKTRVFLLLLALGSSK